MDEHNSPSALAISIGRQPGSGGAELGRRVAMRLGAAYLDQEILRDAAKQLGVDDQHLACRKECVTRFWTRMLSAFAIGAPDETYTAYGQRSEIVPMIPDEALFNAQARAMRELVAQGDSVVIGHAGFYVLRDHPCHVKVFVHATLDERARRVSGERHIDLATARTIVRQGDEDRRSFIQKISGCDWTNARNYDLCIDSGRLSMELAEELIAAAVQERRRQCTAP
jgi:cytidylate kinase